MVLVVRIKQTDSQMVALVMCQAIGLKRGMDQLSADLLNGRLPMILELAMTTRDASVITLVMVGQTVLRLKLTLFLLLPLLLLSLLLLSLPLLSLFLPCLPLLQLLPNLSQSGKTFRRSKIIPTTLKINNLALSTRLTVRWTSSKLNY